jgi:hypothetical protein
MDENKIWANLNDSWNLDIILIENENIKEYVPKKEKFKPESNKIEKNINMEEILLEIFCTDFLSCNILELISKQNTVASYLLKLFRNSKLEEIDWEKYKPGLTWLLSSSKFIVSKSNGFVQLFKNDKIYRSSYKFCNKKDECEALYCNFIKKTSDRVQRCNGDHYVHNKLISDLTNLITMLDIKTENISNDLRICLDTVNFVINHMYQELNTFNIYHSKQPNFDINKYYITAVPLKKKN